MSFSKDRKEVRESAMWLSWGRALLVEGMAYARAPRKQLAWKSKEAHEVRGK